MKSLLQILLPYFLYVPISVAQLSAGNKGIFISNATILTIDGMSLVPDGEFEMNNNAITMSHTPAAGEFKSSIKRVYSFAEPAYYHGGVGIHYLLSELNGNQETKLQIAVVGVPSLTLFPSSLSTVFPATSYIYNTINLPIRVISAMDKDQSALPVTLISFGVTNENNTALLSWATSNESNSSYFEIQKSIDAKAWKMLARVEAAGESNEKKEYALTDADVNGKAYYRLKMVDLDGSFTFSRIREIDGLNGTHENIVYPNPVHNTLHMKASAVSMMRSAEIYNLSGKLVDSLIVSTENDVQKLLSGIYILKINYLDGHAGSFKIIKL